MKRPGRLVCESWEAAAMLRGTMCQKRVAGPSYFWKPGQLRWVQEPFIEFTDRARPTRSGIVFRADHAGEMAAAPPHLKHVGCKVKMREAGQMFAGSSRLTIEITGIEHGRMGNDFRDGDEKAEGLDVLREWDEAAADIGRTVWKRNQPLTLIRFTVIKANIATVMAQRAA